MTALNSGSKIRYDNVLARSARENQKRREKDLKNNVKVLQKKVKALQKKVKALTYNFEDLANKVGNNSETILLAFKKLVANDFKLPSSKNETNNDIQDINKDQA